MAVMYKAEKNTGIPYRLHAAICSYFSGISARLPDEQVHIADRINDLAYAGEYNKAHALTVRHKICPPQYASSQEFPIMKFRAHIQRKINHIENKEEQNEEAAQEALKSLSEQFDQIAYQSAVQKLRKGMVLTREERNTFRVYAFIKALQASLDSPITSIGRVKKLQKAIERTPLAAPRPIEYRSDSGTYSKPNYLTSFGERTPLTDGRSSIQDNIDTWKKHEKILESKGVDTETILAERDQFYAKTHELIQKIAEHYPQEKELLENQLHQVYNKPHIDKIKAGTIAMSLSKLATVDPYLYRQKVAQRTFTPGRTKSERVGDKDLPPTAQVIREVEGKQAEENARNARGKAEENAAKIKLESDAESESEDATEEGGRIEDEPQPLINGKFVLPSRIESIVQQMQSDGASEKIGFLYNKYKEDLAAKEQEFSESQKQWIKENSGLSRSNPKLFNRNLGNFIKANRQVLLGQLRRHWGQIYSTWQSHQRNKTALSNIDRYFDPVKKHQVLQSFPYQRGIDTGKKNSDGTPIFTSMKGPDTYIKTGIYQSLLDSQERAQRRILALYSAMRDNERFINTQGQDIKDHWHIIDPVASFKDQNGEPKSLPDNLKLTPGNYLERILDEYIPGETRNEDPSWALGSRYSPAWDSPNALIETAQKDNQGNPIFEPRKNPSTSESTRRELYPNLSEEDWDERMESSPTLSQANIFPPGKLKENSYPKETLGVITGEERPDPKQEIDGIKINRASGENYQEYVGRIIGEFHRAIAEHALATRRIASVARGAYTFSPSRKKSSPKYASPIVGGTSGFVPSLSPQKQTNLSTDVNDKIQQLQKEYDIISNSIAQQAVRSTVGVSILKENGFSNQEIKTLPKIIQSISLHNPALMQAILDGSANESQIKDLISARLTYTNPETQRLDAEVESPETRLNQDTKKNIDKNELELLKKFLPFHEKIVQKHKQSIPKVSRQITQPIQVYGGMGKIINETSKVFNVNTSTPDTPEYRRLSAIANEVADLRDVGSHYYPSRAEIRRSLEKVQDLQKLAGTKSFYGGMTDEQLASLARGVPLEEISRMPNTEEERLRLGQEEKDRYIKHLDFLAHQLRLTLSDPTRAESFRDLGGRATRKTRLEYAIDNETRDTQRKKSLTEKLDSIRKELTERLAHHYEGIPYRRERSLATSEARLDELSREYKRIYIKLNPLSSKQLAAKKLQDEERRATIRSFQDKPATSGDPGSGRIKGERLLPKQQDTSIRGSMLSRDPDGSVPSGYPDEFFSTGAGGHREDGWLPGTRHSAWAVTAGEHYGAILQHLRDNYSDPEEHGELLGDDKKETNYDKLAKAIENGQYELAHSIILNLQKKMPNRLVVEKRQGSVSPEIQALLDSTSSGTKLTPENAVTRYFSHVTERLRQVVNSITIPSQATLVDKMAPEDQETFKKLFTPSQRRKYEEEKSKAEQKIKELKLNGERAGFLSAGLSRYLGEDKPEETNTLSKEAVNRIILLTDRVREARGLPELSDEEYEQWAHAEEQHLISEYNLYSKRMGNTSLSDFAKHLQSQADFAGPQIRTVRDAVNRYIPKKVTDWVRAKYESTGNTREDKIKKAYNDIFYRYRILSSIAKKEELSEDQKEYIRQNTSSKSNPNAKPVSWETLQEGIQSLVTQISETKIIDVLKKFGYNNQEVEGSLQKIYDWFKEKPGRTDSPPKDLFPKQFASEEKSKDFLKKIHAAYYYDLFSTDETRSGYTIVKDPTTKKTRKLFTVAPEYHQMQQGGWDVDELTRLSNALMNNRLPEEQVPLIEKDTDFGKHYGVVSQSGSHSAIKGLFYDPQIQQAKAFQKFSKPQASVPQTDTPQSFINPKLMTPIEYIQNRIQNFNEAKNKLDSKHQTLMDQRNQALSSAIQQIVDYAESLRAQSRLSSPIIGLSKTLHQLEQSGNYNEIQRILNNSRPFTKGEDKILWNNLQPSIVEARNCVTNANILLRDQDQIDKSRQGIQSILAISSDQPSQAQLDTVHKILQDPTLKEIEDRHEDVNLQGQLGHQLPAANTSATENNDSLYTHDTFPKHMFKPTTPDSLGTEARIQKLNKETRPDLSDRLRTLGSAADAPTPAKTSTSTSGTDVADSLKSLAIQGDLNNSRKSWVSLQVPVHHIADEAWSQALERAQRAKSQTMAATQVEPSGSTQPAMSRRTQGGVTAGATRAKKIIDNLSEKRQAEGTSDLTHNHIIAFHTSRWAPIIDPNHHSYTPLNADGSQNKDLVEVRKQVKSGLEQIARGNYTEGHDVLRKLVLAPEPKNFDKLTPTEQKQQRHADIVGEHNIEPVHFNPAEKDEFTATMDESGWSDKHTQAAIAHNKAGTFLPKVERSFLNYPVFLKKSLPKLPHQSFEAVPFPFRVGWFR